MEKIALEENGNIYFVHNECNLYDEPSWREYVSERAYEGCEINLDYALVIKSGSWEKASPEFYPAAKLFDKSCNLEKDLKEVLIGKVLVGVGVDVNEFIQKGLKAEYGFRVQQSLMEDNFHQTLKAAISDQLERSI